MPSQRKTPTVDDQIDENLKRVYQDVLTEAVPDRFLDLLAQLRATEAPPPPDTPDQKDPDDA